MPEASAFELRHERPGDEPGIEAVLITAFGRNTEARLVRLLGRHGKATLSLVAAMPSDIVGHALFSPVSIDGGGASLPGVGLGPVAVRPECQRQGVASALIRTGLRECADLGVGWVVVLGDPAFYGRFGFLPASASDLRCVYAAPPEAFMVFEIVRGCLAGAYGTVHYAPEFGAAE